MSLCGVPPHNSRQSPTSAGGRAGCAADLIKCGKKYLIKSVDTSIFRMLFVSCVVTSSCVLLCNSFTLIHSVRVYKHPGGLDIRVGF